MNPEDLSIVLSISKFWICIVALPVSLSTYAFFRDFTSDENASLGSLIVVLIMFIGSIIGLCVVQHVYHPSGFPGGLFFSNSKIGIVIVCKALGDCPAILNRVICQLWQQTRFF